MAAPNSVAAHKKILDTPGLDESLDAALLQTEHHWALGVRDQYTAMAVGLKLLGVREFIETFKLLAETERRPNITALGGLQSDLSGQQEQANNRKAQ
jgi:hypothetical protein